MLSNIGDIRRDYKLKSLLEDDVAAEPMQQFETWWNEAVSSQIDEVNAMTLATCSREGVPSARIVLLKGICPQGFTFFTNYDSNKGVEIAQNPQVALVFFWKELERQVRVQGTIEKVSPAESDAYFNSRPQGSKVGAWASPQSKPVSNREWLEENFLELSEKFKDGAVPRPQHWGGYLVKPVKMEFWQGRSSRLHDRILYTKQSEGWQRQRLAP